ncbi:hypothetical protein EC973_001322 [Apophysomyces ossiformis]|uniref:MSP domain-containing protein n=1 Tax=Apophysomyces ossiformis TaxID=679940 RepID=A0A8H7ETD0_9FUNG|nr:hypothetical protein EC973_001322 [Apophysomyces ossiformis]
MRKSYASSVYSQKSTTSAKSGRSFLSINAFVWPITTSNGTSNEDVFETNKQQGLWKNLKAWIPTKRRSGSTKDTDSIGAVTVSSSSSSVGSSSSSYLKLKRLFITPAQMIKLRSDDKKSPATEDTNESSIESSSVSDKSSAPTGILLNRGDSVEALAEQKRRRQERRQYLLKVQRTQDHFRPQSGQRESEEHDRNMAVTIPPRRRHVSFGDAFPLETSSSSTVLSTPPDATPKDEKDVMSPREDREQEKDEEEDSSWFARPRVAFVEPSPVPRFRNVAPAPPPSPPYLHVLAEPSNDSNDNSNNNNNDGNDVNDEKQLGRKNSSQSIITTSTDNDSPTVLTTRAMEHHHNKTLTTLYPSRKPQLCFMTPLRRGQTLTFSLQNALPEDHIIVFKFLTSNAKLIRRKKGEMPSVWLGSSTSSIATAATGHGGSLMERYFVRPSAGRMISTDQANIMLFLNQVPPLAPGEVLKDKILVRWAVIQRHTQVDAWVQSLPESTRRKWLEMLIEEWPDQVIVRETRIKIRFA